VVTQEIEKAHRTFFTLSSKPITSPEGGWILSCRVKKAHLIYEGNGPIRIPNHNVV
jgi:hypothetical protein